MQLTSKQSDVLAADGHLLVTGGPGSGKTTISIFKAAKIAKGELQTEQNILFLSFARASVSRVAESIEIEQNISNEIKERIRIDTYHSFFWRILKTHGYLVALPRDLSILTPAAEAVALSDIRHRHGRDSVLSDDEKQKKRTDEKVERDRLAAEEGRICFDLFASNVRKLLCGSRRLRKLLATMYPVIILDEFQDTNLDQWRVVEALGEFCRLIALADPEQRIFGFMGADPERLDQYRHAFEPAEFDFSADNHRSGRTEIAIFANHVLKGAFPQKSYKGILRKTYGSGQDEPVKMLAATVYAAQQRLDAADISEWSIAVLVPTKKMTRFVSDKFRTPPPCMSPIAHTAVVDIEAGILGSEVIAHLMQPDAMGNHLADLVCLLCSYFQGKGGDRPTKTSLDQAIAISTAYDKWRAAMVKNRRVSRNSLMHRLLSVYNQVRETAQTGDPDKDWRAVRKLLEEGDCRQLRDVGSEVRNVRLLERGGLLRQELAQNWRDKGAYENAHAIVRQAFAQEHLATRRRRETGVIVMNMHKAKGKQFDEVIIFEGWPRRKGNRIVANPDRIVRGNCRAGITDESRRNLRVSITRARRHATILTPKLNPCVLLRAKR